MSLDFLASGTHQGNNMLLWWLDGKDSAFSAGDSFDPWVGKIPDSGKWHPTSVFLPGKPHGQRSLTGYSPWGYKESNTTEQLTTSETKSLEIMLSFVI